MSIDTFLLQHDAALRFGSMLFTFAVLAGWELFAPQRRLKASKSARWPHTIALAAINMAFVRVLFPVAAVLIAAAAERRDVGLLNVVQLPYPVAVLAGLLAFDFAVYFVHVAFHAAPALWRMHRLHHTGTDVDVSTGLRFHPIQVVLSWLVKLAVVVLVGTPVLSVVLFETVFHAIVLFNHANVVIRPGVDRVLRWFIVTPAMHCVHHSALMEETNSNFGFALPWWDRLLGTYREAPIEGLDRVKLGIGSFGEARDFRLDRMLLNPVLNDDEDSRVQLTPVVKVGAP